MIFPDAPVHMKDLAGQTVDKFGYDTISKVRYKFNNVNISGSAFENIIYQNSIKFDKFD